MSRLPPLSARGGRVSPRSESASPRPTSPGALAGVHHPPHTADARMTPSGSSSHMSPVPPGGSRSSTPRPPRTPTLPAVSLTPTTSRTLIGAGHAGSLDPSPHGHRAGTAGDGFVSPMHLSRATPSPPPPQIQGLSPANALTRRPTARRLAPVNAGAGAVSSSSPFRAAFEAATAASRPGTTRNREAAHAEQQAPAIARH